MANADCFCLIVQIKCREMSSKTSVPWRQSCNFATSRLRASRSAERCTRKSIIPVGPILAAIRSLEPFPGDFLYIPKLTRKSRFVINQWNSESCVASSSSACFRSRSCWRLERVARSERTSSLSRPILDKAIQIGFQPAPGKTVPTGGSTRHRLRPGALGRTFDLSQRPTSLRGRDTTPAIP